MVEREAVGREVGLTTYVADAYIRNTTLDAEAEGQRTLAAAISRGLGSFGRPCTVMQRTVGSGRCWARTSDLRLVETALSQLS